MRKLALISILLMFSLAFTGIAAADSHVPPGRKNFKDVDFETVDAGQWSYVRYGNFSFPGVLMIIKKQENWEEFWADHKSGIHPTPPLPEVEFN
jgi:hypothetical protein